MSVQSNSFINRIKDQLKHRYRLVVMNDETFEEVGSYRLTWLNVYIAFSVFFVLVVLLVVITFIFTPIKQYLPGFGDINQREELWKLEKQIESLEEEVNARTVYIKHVQDALTANVKYEPTEIPEEETGSNILDSTINTKPIPEDYQIRKTVERQESEVNGQLTAASLSTPERSIEQIYFVAPLKGTISEGFRPAKKHYGVDIIAPRNTPIKAIADGVVISSDWTYDTGNVVAVQHDNNIVSFYKHNSVLLKKVGSFVKAGEAVAIIGNTGELTDGPHLHFELWHKGKAIDPIQYISFN